MESVDQQTGADTFGVGEIVKYSDPENGPEAAARFIVLEDRGNRLYVEFITDKMVIKPTECLFKRYFLRA